MARCRQDLFFRWRTRSSGATPREVRMGTLVTRRYNFSSTRLVQLERSECVFACSWVANRAATSTRYTYASRLLTEGFQVRVLAEEPILSTACSQTSKPASKSWYKLFAPFFPAYTLHCVAKLRGVSHRILRVWFQKGLFGEPANRATWFISMPTRPRG